MEKETAIAINNISKRLNAVERKLEKFLLDRHEENKEAISNCDEAIAEILFGGDVNNE